MKHEIRVNGRLVLEITPESDIEKLVTAKMSAAASKGKAVTLSQVGDKIQIAVEE